MKKILLLLTIFLSGIATPQEIIFPRLSPSAQVSQTIGIASVSVQYSRPAVKGRTVWGDLVPYGQMWRTGANENTTITFSEPVQIEGEELPAGTYGFHTIPSQDSWEIILSKDTKLWGSMGYKKENDALRFTVKPQKNTFAERLTFEFTDVTDTSSVLMLFWEEVAVKFNLVFDTPVLVMKKVNNKVDFRTPLQAASYIYQNKLDPELGIHYADISIAVEENYMNTLTKGRLLEMAGKTDEAVTLVTRAIELGREMKTPPRDMAETEVYLEKLKSKK